MHEFFLLVLSDLPTLTDTEKIAPTLTSFLYVIIVEQNFVKIAPFSNLTQLLPYLRLAGLGFVLYCLNVIVIIEESLNFDGLSGQHFPMNCSKIGHSYQGDRTPCSYTIQWMKHLVFGQNLLLANKNSYVDLLKWAVTGNYGFYFQVSY